MDTFYGFDLGDAESALARLDGIKDKEPEILKVRGQGSFVTSYAVMPDGTLLVGEEACYAAGAVRRKLRFKSAFLTDRESNRYVETFAKGVLGELYADGNLDKNSECCFYIGCPAGWDKNTRERYREIFERAGYPPARIVSESRAAMISACQSRHLQVGTDILKKPVLVVDIGSSTTDFAYIRRGKEEKLQTGGEVHLGGGIMDEILLDECIRAAGPLEKKIRRDLNESEPWKNYCEFSARRLKEKYFGDEPYFAEHGISRTLEISLHTPVKLKLFLNPEMADRLLETGSQSLDGKSFHEAFVHSLKEARSGIRGEMPELLFLTGGVSKLPKIRDWCQEIFPDAVIIGASDPEYSVAKGLAFAGQVDEKLRNFRKQLDDFIASDQVETIVQDHMDALIRSAVDTLVEPVLQNAAFPVFLEWREGKVRRLEDVSKKMQEKITEYLKSDEAEELLKKPTQDWLRKVSAELEKYTVPICIRNGVPYRALSLSSYLEMPDVSITVDASDVFAIREITFLIDAIISIVVGLLCGGSGIALISSGLPGIAAGVVLSIMVLFLGRGQMEKALMKADIPVPLRKLIPKGTFENRMDSISEEIRTQLYQSLEAEKNGELTGKLSKQISEQIEQFLLKMAEVVEIPLG